MIESPILALIFLIGSGLLTGINCVMQRIGKAQVETLAKQQKGLARFVFKKSKRDLFIYASTVTKNILIIIYAITAFIFSIQFFPQEQTTKHFVLAGFVILGSSVLLDFLMRAISLFRPHNYFKTTCQITSIFLILFWPFSLLIFKMLKSILPKAKETTSFRMKDKILEILHDSEFAPYLDANDQKLILSVTTFKERIAREVMVPRIDMFTLSADTTIQEASKGFFEERYSRIPVWKDNLDNIIGALYYKDLLNFFFTQPTPTKLDASIENLVKPIVYTPETKKISQLLQEFLNKKILLAIVVDEYGGTEGLVTIEDILEELVGEIADEYDHDEESFFTPIPSGGWIVDAKMTIFDIETELSIVIEQSPEYETIGGYIFHKAGTIPSKGWRLHHDDFDLEVLSSSERSIEKIRLTPNE